MAILRCQVCGRKQEVKGKKNSMADSDFHVCSRDCVFKWIRNKFSIGMWERFKNKIIGFLKLDDGECEFVLVFKEKFFAFVLPESCTAAAQKWFAAPSNGHHETYNHMIY